MTPSPSNLEEETLDKNVKILDVPEPELETELEPEKLETNKSTNVILRLIINHYSNVDSKRSDKQQQSERFLFPGVAFNRWILIPAAVLIQFCVGSLYAWSVFNKPIEQHIFGESRNLAPNAFYIACGTLGLSGSVMGPWLERNGPRKAALLGTFLFVAGHLLTALAVYYKFIYLIFLSYGIISGFGIGLCYISPVSCLQKWFPDKRGLASGFAVAGFGGGSIAIGKVILPLIDWIGLPLTFVALATLYLTVMTIGALALRSPPSDYTVVGQTVTSPNNDRELTTFLEKSPQPTEKDEPTTPTTPKLTLIQALTSKDFRLLYIVFLANILFCLVSISRLQDMVIDIFGRSPSESSTVVSINGGFNVAGRLVFPLLSDHIGRKSCYFIMLSCQLVIVGLFTVVTSQRAYTLFVAMMWLLMACYGGGFGTLPAYLSDLFGSKNVGAAHGVCLTAWSLSGVVGGFVYSLVYNWVISSSDYENDVDKSDPLPYSANVWWIGFVVLAGWISILFVTPSARDRIFRGNVSRFMRKICKCRQKS